MPEPLSRKALSGLDPQIGRPTYDLSTVRAGIVHLGLGGFHRAHMARYTHDLMQLDAASTRWGIVGVGLRQTDDAVLAALGRQDRLYTLVERSRDQETLTVIGALAGLEFTPGGGAGLLAVINRPEIRIVSLTITEHGYCLNAATKRLDPDHPDIVRDLADPEHPTTAIGIIVEAYRRRMMIGAPAFTAMSCDNIQHNGHVLRQAVLDYAGLRDDALGAWIAREARFPNTMVDRITPVTAKADVIALADRHGIADGAPVFCETFTQWVIEDDFTLGRPDWERVGAQFVSDVAPYEFMKLRLLNGSHLAIAGLGRLIGYEFIHETMADPRLRQYMRDLMDLETGPTLPPVPGVDLTAYKATLIERFANPMIRDTVNRVNADAVINYLLDPIRDRLARGESIELLGLAVAAWLRRVSGTDEAGLPIEVRHPLADLLRERAKEGGPDPLPLLRIHALFSDLAENAVFVSVVSRWLASLYEIGAARTLEIANAATAEHARA